MANIVSTKLDPLFEIIGLLATVFSTDKSKNRIYRDLDEISSDGKIFYEKQLKILDEYVETFQKHCIVTKECDCLISNDNFNITILILSLLTENRELINDINEMDEKQIIKEIIAHCEKLFQIKMPNKKLANLDDIIDFLDASSIEKDEKWNILKFIQNPKKYLIAIINSVNQNKEAFKLANQTVQTQLSKLISQYKDLMENKNKSLFKELRNAFSNKGNTFPTLVFPLSHIIFGKTNYYGVLSHLIVLEKNKDFSKDQLLQGLKALSDKSKLEILCSLKISPKYNLEIAEELNLTAATMSHHMGVLLASNFVAVIKKDGKVYYHIEEEIIRKFILKLEQTLL